MDKSYNQQNTPNCICCSVSNCIHNCDKKCSATEVHVGPKSACCTAETGCETFQSK